MPCSPRPPVTRERGEQPMPDASPTDETTGSAHHGSLPRLALLVKWLPIPTQIYMT
jgi:hypothetical protein